TVFQRDNGSRPPLTAASFFSGNLSIRPLAALLRLCFYPCRPPSRAAPQAQCQPAFERRAELSVVHFAHEAAHVQTQCLIVGKTVRPQAGCDIDQRIKVSAM